MSPEKREKVLAAGRARSVAYNEALRLARQVTGLTCRAYRAEYGESQAVAEEIIRSAMSASL
jgi:hypothetical protein